MAKGDIIDRIIDFVNNLTREVVPIIGTPGSGKTYFLASLTKWVLQKIQEPERVFLEGREYLFDLAVRYASIELEPSNRSIKEPLIERNVPTESIEEDLHRILLHIPIERVFELKGSLDLFTIDGPGEVLVKHPEILAAMISNLKGLILLVDVIGDKPETTSIDWKMVTNNALHSVHGLAEVVEDELAEDTPIALVVTKWDRLLSLKGFKDEEERKNSWNEISTRLKNIYLPLLKQHNAQILFHSSVGIYSSFEDAYKAGEELFPFPIGLDLILEHCISYAK